MPKVEIEEAELLASQATIAAVNGMLANPVARKMLLQARKVADPKAVIPEIDAAEPVNAEVARLTKLIEDDRTERATERQAREQADRLREARENLARQEATLRAAGWSSEGITEVKKHAEERGIFDLEVAAAHFEKLHPPAEPVQPNGSGSWGFFDQSDDGEKFVKAMIESKGDDERALDVEIGAALKDYRTQQAAVRR